MVFSPVHGRICLFKPWLQAGLLRLDMDVLCAIVHIGLQSAGCTHITLADMIRWMREGRCVVSPLQFNALRRVCLYDDGKMAVLREGGEAERHDHYYVCEGK